ncbi:MAG: hypothetical protein IBX61_03915 [Thermoleophilia bacterium]|nr:hypothetical protein [Thermoleophilia bacterium]
MSGKGWGKKRNRAAQSEQHGFQQPPAEQAAQADTGRAGTSAEKTTIRQRVLDKIRMLEQRRRDQGQK